RPASSWKSNAASRFSPCDCCVLFTHPDFVLYCCRVRRNGLHICLAATGHDQLAPGLAFRCQLETVGVEPLELVLEVELELPAVLQRRLHLHQVTDIALLQVNHVDATLEHGVVGMQHRWVGAIVIFLACGHVGRGARGKGNEQIRHKQATQRSHYCPPWMGYTTVRRTFPVS